MLPILLYNIWTITPLPKGFLGFGLLMAFRTAWPTQQNIWKYKVLLSHSLHLLKFNSFSDAKVFYQYIVQSSGSKQWECTVCGKEGNDRGNLRKHVENIHFPGTFSYSCKYCCETLSSRTALNHHITLKHNPHAVQWIMYHIPQSIVNSGIIQ